MLRRTLCHSYSPSSHKELKVCQPLCHISARATVSQSLPPLLLPPPSGYLAYNSFPYHFMLPTSLFASAPSPDSQEFLRHPSRPGRKMKERESSATFSVTMLAKCSYRFSGITSFYLANSPRSKQLGLQQTRKNPHSMNTSAAFPGCYTLNLVIPLLASMSMPSCNNCASPVAGSDTDLYPQE